MGYAMWRLVVQPLTAAYLMGWVCVHPSAPLRETRTVCKRSILQGRVCVYIPIPPCIIRSTLHTYGVHVSQRGGV